MILLLLEIILSAFLYKGLYILENRGEAFRSLSLLGFMLNSQETTVLPISGKRSTVAGSETFQSRRQTSAERHTGGCLEFMTS